MIHKGPSIILFKNKIKSLKNTIIYTFDSSLKGAL